MPDLMQLKLFDGSDNPALQMSTTVMNAVEEMALNDDVEGRGAVFTKLEVVEFILDLVGYSDKKKLYRRRMLEPSFGNGDFLLPIIDRLISSWRSNLGDVELAVESLEDAICAVELHKATFESTRSVAIKKLKDEGLSLPDATKLADSWLIQGDFLLETNNGEFDYVVGNPPYVRQELISAPLLAEYRLRYRTMYDRADLYVPFMERSLSLLGRGGVLGFICADRWIKNRYGGPLRKLISHGFHLRAYIDMTDTSAFHSEVSAYPAITVIGREKPGMTRVAHRPQIDKNLLASVASDVLTVKLPKESSVREIGGVVNGPEPWLLESPDQMVLIRRIEEQYPDLEQAGCKVGIGVATGADKAFIGDFESLDVEPDRKLPLVAPRDIQSGEVVWRGLGVINPFADDGRLVNLDDYPKLARYLDFHKDAIRKRHCAKKKPSNWYRTIDRIWPDLAKKSKLLIPDIKGEAHIVFESGKLYPHHNLYYVTSGTWDLRALQAVLLSSVSRLFVATYSTKMRGGYLRFQAQYLRRIRIPAWQNVSDKLKQELKSAAEVRDLVACNMAAFELYGLNQKERSTLGGNGD